MKRIFLICLTSLLFSCAGTHKVTEKTSTTNSKENTEIVKDSTLNSEINKKIDDAVNLIVTRSNTSDAEFNKAVDRAVDDILSKLNMTKQSGDNSYSLMYDKVKRELLLQMQVGETKSTSQTVNKSEKIEKSFEQVTDEYFSKKINMIPWWVWVAGAIWFLPKIIERVMLIVNPIRAMIKKSPS